MQRHLTLGSLSFPNKLPFPESEFNEATNVKSQRQVPYLWPYELKTEHLLPQSPFSGPIMLFTAPSLLSHLPGMIFLLYILQIKVHSLAQYCLTQAELITCWASLISVSGALSMPFPYHLPHLLKPTHFQISSWKMVMSLKADTTSYLSLQSLHHTAYSRHSVII